MAKKKMTAKQAKYFGGKGKGAAKGAVAKGAKKAVKKGKKAAKAGY